MLLHGRSVTHNKILNVGNIKSGLIPDVVHTLTINSGYAEAGISHCGYERLVETTAKRSSLVYSNICNTLVMSGAPVSDKVALSAVI